MRNLFETCIDVGSGLFISTLLESFHIAVIFTFISICRSWFWRTIFGRKKKPRKWSVNYENKL